MKKLLLVVATALSAIASPASAANVIVDAATNSSTPGNGKLTGLIVTAGAKFRVFVNPADLWNAGSLPRWSNADGLTADRFATGSDDSGQPMGTLIGSNFGTYSQGNLSAPYGTLVGRIGNLGNFFAIGTNSSPLTAGNGGELQLFYWDSNQGDNTQFITANVVAGIPEPAAWGLMILGFGFIGGAVRARKQQARASFA